MMNKDLSVIVEDEDGSFKETMTNKSIRLINKKASSNTAEPIIFRTPTNEKTLDKLMQQMAQLSEYAANSSAKELPPSSKEKNL